MKLPVARCIVSIGGVQTKIVAPADAARLEAIVAAADEMRKVISYAELDPCEPRKDGYVCDHDDCMGVRNYDRLRGGE